MLESLVPYSAFLALLTVGEQPRIITEAHKSVIFVFFNKTTCHEFLIKLGNMHEINNVFSYWQTGVLGNGGLDGLNNIIINCNSKIITLFRCERFWV